MSPPRTVGLADFIAADNLKSALWQLNDKIKWLLSVRDGNRTKCLESGATAWTGARHDTFVGELEAQKKALAQLAEEALTLMSKIDAAERDATSTAPRPPR